MPEIAIKLNAEPLRSIDTSTLNGSYASLGALIAHPARVLKFANLSNVDVMVSYDGGVTTHEIIPASSSFVFDITSNRVWDDPCVLAKGTQISVSSAKGTGFFYMSSYYVT